MLPLDSRRICPRESSLRTSVVPGAEIIKPGFNVPFFEGEVLPHAVAYNLPAIPAARSVIERVFGGADAAGALFDFARSIDAPARTAIATAQPESFLNV